MKGTSRTTRFASITSFALTIVLLLSGILIAAPPAHAVPTEPLGSPAVAPTEIGPPGSYAEGGIIVSLSKGGQHAARADALAGTLAALSKSEGTSGMILGGSGTVLEQEDGTCVSLVRFPQDVSVPRAIAEALKDPAVLSAEPNYLGTLCDDGQEAEPAEPPAPDEIETFGITNDPMLQVGQQWWHGTDKINSINAWDKAKTNGAVTVVVIDSGIRFDHQDLAANVDASRARSFIIDNNNRVEYIGPLAPSFGKGGDGGSSGHGTMVSGIVAATANNGLGGAGVSYNARILPVNVFPNGVNSVSSYSMIQALDYLTGLKTSGAVPSLKVANMSVQFIAAGPQFHAAVQRLRSAGVLPVAAAGNYGNDAPVYPSDWPEALSVTSIDQNDAFSDFSCHNYNKDIAAYGRGIWTTTNVDSTSYTSDYGTSFAAPMAAGAAALVFSLRPDFTPELVQSVLTSSSIDMGAE
ncbi:MAG: S8 family serine peptidase, partial [Coriobacteriales bacterium]|nr:S8 family serine peptidase [Coriobacteriales bacterium]